MNAAITIYEDHPLFKEVAASLAEGETTVKASSKKKASKKKASAKTTGDLAEVKKACLLYTSPSPRDLSTSRMPSSA